MPKHKLHNSMPQSSQWTCQQRRRPLFFNTAVNFWTPYTFFQSKLTTLNPIRLFSWLAYCLKLPSRQTHSKSTVHKSQKKQPNAATSENLSSAFGIGPTLAYKTLLTYQSHQNFSQRPSLGNLRYRSWYLDKPFNVICH